MKKIATIALTVAALSLAFTLASCSGGSSGGGSSSGSSSGLPATSPYGSGPASDAAGASSAITLLDYDDSELNNKIFKRVYDDDGETKTKYYLFYNGNCYESSNQNVTPSNNQDDDDPDIIGYGGKFYREAGDDEFERISGSGLFATFRSADHEMTMTFKSDGTFTASMEEDGETFTLPGYFRNVSGVIDLTLYTPDGETFTSKVFYDGTYLTTIDSQNELIFVNNYSELVR
ncbi:MAG: hypothetical protein K6E22_09640 [Treponema sp.]|nr:hypothetical protein [Treponema sp.]